MTAYTKEWKRKKKKNKQTRDWEGFIFYRYIYTANKALSGGLNLKDLQYLVIADFLRWLFIHPREPTTIEGMNPCLHWTHSQPCQLLKQKMQGRLGTRWITQAFCGVPICFGFREVYVYKWPSVGSVFWACKITAFGTSCDAFYHQIPHYFCIHTQHLLYSPQYLKLCVRHAVTSLHCMSFKHT